MPEDDNSARAKSLIAAEPMDPDLGTAGQLARRTPSAELANLAVISLGGIIGAIGRYEAGLVWPTRSDAFPWTTLAINVLGSALLAVLIVLVTTVWSARPWLRPLLGTGVLGGFTTFSTFAVDNRRLLANGHAPLAITYLLATVGLCTVATLLGGSLTRAAISRGRFNRGPA
jgi:CrcB protein